MEAPLPRPGLWHGLPETLKAFLILALFTLATRAWIFGDPVVNIDEQFYLMVGDRMLHGSLPYVDIWDRKPIGLFLIYAAACRLFADAVWGYQIMATISVILTSSLLFAMARRATSFWPALAGAAVYPAWLLVFGGVGGQSPVFYDLPMAMAAAWTLKLVIEPRNRNVTAEGCAIMVLAGIAMQIKYVAMFEGIFFGLTLLWLGLSRGRSLLVLAGHAVVWVLSALLPTVAAWGVYAAMGHGDAFVQANFLSIFGDTNPLLEAVGRLAALTFGLSPLLLCFGIVWRRRAGMDEAAPRAVAWMLGWAIASYAGFLIYGIWYDHYVLPVLMPLSLVAALAFGSVGWWRRLTGLVIGLGLVGGTARAAVDVQMNGNERELAQLSALVAPNLGNGCLYVNEELSALYKITRSCLPTRFVFPQHLALVAYQHALGIDQLFELRRVLASQPAVIVLSLTPDEYTRPETRSLLEAALKRGYRLAGTAIVGNATYAVYPLIRPPASKP
ncbi:ArnT family glycosyltransferase [Novosphingobium lentum]|uniref:ArnT family glycosyltransferase n=1 Tax=Novosphingobium lentum TaxID=145287 RepID=UPI00082BBB7A|nr:glycosyltransferase family 39 protein [Novosphingobium lentum]